MQPGHRHAVCAGEMAKRHGLSARNNLEGTLAVVPHFHGYGTASDTAPDRLCGKPDRAHRKIGRNYLRLRRRVRNAMLPLGEPGKTGKGGGAANREENTRGAAGRRQTIRERGIRIQVQRAGP